MLAVSPRRVADLQARLVPLDRLVVVPLLGSQRAGEVLDLTEAGVVGQPSRRRSRRSRAAMPPRRSALPGAPLRQVRPRTRPAERVVAELLGEGERLALHLLGALPVARQLEHLAEPQQHVDALGLRHERGGPLEVVDRRCVGVARLGGLAGAHEELALLGRVVAVPVVVGEQVELMLDGVGPVCSMYTATRSCSMARVANGRLS